MGDAENQEPNEDESTRQALEDLDVGDDADQVIGGKIECPCMGGEIHRPR